MHSSLKKKISFQKFHNLQEKTQRKDETERRGEEHLNVFLIIHTPIPPLYQCHHPQVPTLETIKFFGGEATTTHPVGNHVATYPTK